MPTRLTETTRKRFRRTIRVFFWRKAVMPCYYKCPHEYVVRQRDLILRGAPWRITEMEFQFLKKVIAKHGERVKWRHRRDVVLFEGRYVYWRCGGVINRTYRMSYLNGGRPPEKVLKRLRKRFWPNKRDRRYYYWIANNFC
jgi:hypothetical protein